ncbi:MAG: hypothetical protein H7329_07235, partial [Opitutaceae bacterium]|nr:hypothetical protein [Cytophagales bacterium]
DNDSVKSTWNNVFNGYDSVYRYSNTKIQQAILNLLLVNYYENDRLKHTNFTATNAHSFPIYWKNGKYREMYLPEFHDQYNSDFSLIAANKNSVSFEHITSTPSNDEGKCEIKYDNYAIRGDSLTKISLSDLFKVNADYDKVLNTLLLKKIEQLEDKRTDCEYQSNILNCLEERWLIAPKGLTFVIRTSDSCEDKKEVTISYPSLKPIINLKGVLREFVNTRN